MANEKNLRPSEYKLTQEEAKKGGIASGKARQEKKKFAELMDAYLNKKLPNSDMTRKEALGIKVLNELYENPNIKDLKTLTDILGESVLKVETNHPTLIVTEAMAEAIRKRKEEEEKGA